MIQQIGQQAPEVFAILREFIQQRQRSLDLSAENGLAQAKNLALRGEAEHREDVRLFDFVAAKTDELVERGFSIAHPAVRAAGDGVQRKLVNLHLLQLR